MTVRVRRMSQPSFPPPTCLDYSRHLQHRQHRMAPAVAGAYNAALAGSAPPHTRDLMSVDPRPTLAAPDDDPRLWLEEIEGARALAWVEAQNVRTLAAFGG